MISCEDCRKRMPTRRSLWIGVMGLFLAGLLNVLPGCSTSTAQLRRGQRLELEGRYMEAAFHFVRALEGGLLETNREEARSGLKRVAPSVLTETQKILNAAEAEGEWERAIRAVEGVLILKSRAEQFGIDLFGGSENKLEDLGRRAALAAYQHAQRLEGEGRWSDAIAAYDQALQQFNPDSSLVPAVAFGQTRALVRQGEELLLEGDYQGAIRMADRALDNTANPALTDEARRLRAEAEAVKLAEEVFVPTYYFAALPFTVEDSTGASHLEAVHSSLNDTLRYAFWSERPQVMFEHGRPSSYLGGGDAASILAEDPTAIFRIVLAREAEDGVASDAQARSIGLELDVDIVLRGRLSGYQIVDMEGASFEEKVRRASCRVDYRLIDVFGTGLAGNGTFEIGASMTYAASRLERTADDPAVSLPPAQELTRPTVASLNARLVRRIIDRLKREVSEDLVALAGSTPVVR